MSVFETLNAINVNEHTEKKGNLTYLSWAWAWAELMKAYPDATSKVYEDENGMNFHTDGRTAWVKCSVTVDGKEIIEYLPVMDYKNNSLPLNEITSRKVSDTIQRCITKAIARHGLGLYIYAGEDLPDKEKDEEEARVAEIAVSTIDEIQAKSVLSAIVNAELNQEAICARFGIKAIEEMNVGQLVECTELINDLKDIKKKMAAAYVTREQVEERYGIMENMTKDLIKRCKAGLKATAEKNK